MSNKEVAYKIKSKLSWEIWEKLLKNCFFFLEEHINDEVHEY